MRHASCERSHNWKTLLHTLSLELHATNQVSLCFHCTIVPAASGVGVVGIAPLARPAAGYIWNTVSNADMFLESQNSYVEVLNACPQRDRRRTETQKKRHAKKEPRFQTVFVPMQSNERRVGTNKQCCAKTYRGQQSPKPTDLLGRRANGRSVTNVDDTTVTLQV